MDVDFVEIWKQKKVAKGNEAKETFILMLMFYLSFLAVRMASLAGKGCKQHSRSTREVPRIKCF